MTAMRTQDLDRPISTTRPATRRAGAARRPVSAAGQNRRTLERNLAAREASLRISRRASGAAGPLTRPAPLPEAPQPQYDPPVARVATATLPTARITPAAAPAPSARPAARVVPAPVAPRPAARPEPAPAAWVAPRTAPAPMPARRPAQPLAMTRPLAIGSAAVAMPAPAPALAPQRRRQLVVLPGGGEQLRERFSVPAMIVGAVLALVLTVGVIVAVQIRVTQLNEQVGHDLSATTQLQQSTVSQREQISTLVSSARIDDEVARKQLIEPDPQDVRFLSAAEAEAVGSRAAQVLRSAPTASAATAAPASATPAAVGATTP